MMLPRWFVALGIAVVATMAGLLVIDWITDERLGAWAPYAIAAALVVLMILSLGAVPRAAARQRRGSRPPGLR